jgi:putative flavoprotein involved in K+ transport
MGRNEVIAYLDDYARSFSAPVQTGVTVGAVECDPAGFRVQTNVGIWRAPNVVIATGYCDRPNSPAMAAALERSVAQVVPSRYHRPEWLRDGGVLVVGASATGIQLAAEIARSGRSVTVAVGRHTRLPRNYRGRDILDWFDAAGVLTETVEQAWDVRASRGQPSLQLVGSHDHRSLDLATLQDAGVRLVGRLVGAYNRRVYLADDLAASIGRAEMKMTEQLDRVDRFVAQRGIQTAHAPDRPAPIPAPASPAVIDLGTEGIRTVVWATGYRREYPWLRVPILDARGEIVHNGGITPQAGMYAMGLNFMRRRNSSFLDGVGTDAVELADHIANRMRRRRVAVG